MGKLVSDEIKALFPLNTIQSIEKFFLAEISKDDPNLALISIVLGAVEHSLTQVVLPSNIAEAPEKIVTSRKNKPKIRYSSATTEKPEIGENGSTKFGKEDKEEESIEEKLDTPVTRCGSELPPLEYETVEALYEQFQIMIVGAVDLTLYSDQIDEEDDSNFQHDFAKEFGKVNGKTSVSKKVLYLVNTEKPSSRSLVKKVSDVVWNNLSTTYGADKPHLQTLYTYLVGKKLDSFGVAIAVVAGCQILGLSDVHLALSEDHAWVYFGTNGNLTAEVTWHGKGHEDRRGQPVGLLETDASSWLYLKGFAVKCNRHMEAASIVSAINPVINHLADSLEIGLIQQKLLWILYDAGYLKRYPMAIATLADLEDLQRTNGKLDCDSLFSEAIDSDRQFYNNMHVYPYTYYGAYLYRKQNFKSAIKLWADAADVIKNYSYTKHDEEIYKEFMEISKDFISNIIKQSSTGISATSLTRDTNSFAQLLRFFDGICLWEESSITPVVHIIWARAWNHAIGKFDSSVRKRLTILLPTAEKEDDLGDKLIHPTEVNDKDLVTDTNKESRNDDDIPTVAITFRSQKMQGIKDLLQQDKFNPGTVTLHLTAQTLVTGHSSNEIDGQEGISGRTRKVKSQGNESHATPELKSPPVKRPRKQ